jgi:ketosteroid isomerase-like protein
MSQENVEIVRDAFEAFLGGDREKTAQLVDPEVEFHGTVGGLQEGQIAHGQSEIDQTFEAEDLEAWEERRLEAEEFIDAGDDVVVLLHEYRRGSATLPLPEKVRSSLPSGLYLARPEVVTPGMTYGDDSPVVIDRRVSRIVVVLEVRGHLAVAAK